VGFDPEKHHRRSIRLQGYDYAQPGAYFVTICTRNRECLLGEVANGEMELNPLGEIVSTGWQDLPDHYPQVQLDAFVVMPDRVHRLIIFTDPIPTTVRSGGFVDTGIGADERLSWSCHCHCEPHRGEAISFILSPTRLTVIASPAGAKQSRMNQQYFVYILTNRTNRVLYTGVTNNLQRRVYEHKAKLIDGFTKKYNVTKLVYYEVFEEIEYAILREKQLKAGSRQKKLDLVNGFNPVWADLFELL